ncbi:protein EARLY-RESPONSIVE TO DEHYDRATION 7, chloroplastic-like [Salvia miltiorrhiza]|uniref:protein EARLY-RESPONSIVE TO DEHYDRATION 7, chloroplastic-like n=1 Tax=Salvia miltiorrhiza TaxID=226208 RepID=UPI0025ACD588|nr:protein EARLY-RESPONSIVE TO DEHYDRATION 7, chloroplastic-like [Salvia miltiorrhiza]
MASQDPNPNRTPMYPQIDPYYPAAPPIQTSSSSSLYPTVDMDELNNLFPSPWSDGNSPSAPPESVQESYITIPGAIVHLIDTHYSVELAAGDLQIIRLFQGDNTVAVVAAVSDEIEWPLTKDLAAVKLDASHYFFSFRPPPEGEGSNSSDEDGAKKNKKKDKKKTKKKEKEKKKGEETAKKDNDVLSYGLTIVSKGQDGLLKELDAILETCSNFSVRKVEEKAVAGAAAAEISPFEWKTDEKKREEVKGQCAAYWTTLAPNVEEYSGTAARLIAMGSGQLVKGILWCGDVTIDRLKWGDEVMRNRMAPGEKAEIDPTTLKRIKRVKRVTKMTQKVATGVLSGVVKVSGYLTGSVANSKMGKKFFNLLPGEVVLASLDGFSKICDAAEVAGKNVMSTSSTVTTGLVSHRYGDEAAKATSEGLDAAGHAVGAAWAVFKIRQAFNPKSVLKPSSLAKSAVKSAAAEAKKSKANSSRF